MKLVGDLELTAPLSRKNREEKAALLSGSQLWNAFLSDQGHAGNYATFSIRGACAEIRIRGQRRRFSNLQRRNYKFGWLQGSRKLLRKKNFWLRGPATIRIV
jgi:hypothetical protein